MTLHKTKEGKPLFLKNISLSAIRTLILFVAFSLCGSSAAGTADDVLVIGDTRLKPVVEMIAGIEESMGRKVPVVSPSEAKGKLVDLVKQHTSRAVIALGRQSIEEALMLPPSIMVLYNLVILPPHIERPNTAGMYMGTPISEYIRLVSSYLPNLKKICVIASPQVLSVLDQSDLPQVTIYQVSNTFDFVETVKNLDDIDALLLLPDLSILTQKALEEIYLFSFRNKVPLLGISKKHVRHGALLALEFDPEASGRNLGIMAYNALKKHAYIQNEAFPPEHFNLYINQKTAKKMDIAIPEEMLEMANDVYP